MLVYVRPSNEALLRARVPGAQGQRGCPSTPFYRGGSASKKDGCLFPLHSLTVTVMGIGSRGLSNSSRTAATILSTTSIPRKTSPKTV